MKNTLVSLALSGTVLAGASGAQFEFQSGEKQVPLVELYTSEGCSSCPPAEAWMGRLKDAPDLWKGFVPVAFHVDYWNSLGWKDRWSSPEFTERQRAYAEAWKSESVYTPCFVVNGKEGRDWSRGATGGDVGVLAVSSSDTNLWQATFVPAKSSDLRYEIHAALLAGGINSDVQAGENRGRRLPHEFALLNLVQMPMATNHGTATGRLIADAARYQGQKELAIAVWVTRSGKLEPIQATGGWLISSAAVSK